MYNSISVGHGILCDGLYKISLNDEFAQSLLSLHMNVGIKRGLINEKSSTCGIDDWGISPGIELKD